MKTIYMLGDFQRVGRYQTEEGKGLLNGEVYENGEWKKEEAGEIAWFGREITEAQAMAAIKSADERRRKSSRG